MEIYDSLSESLAREYGLVKILKKSERSESFVIRHKTTGKWYVLHHFDGEGSVYRSLLEISCPHLPKVLEVGEKNGKTLVLEEYIQGDTLESLLEVELLGIAEAKKIIKQLCIALWVLHSQGAVHRDIKPENVILRGDEAVLIDFDVARMYKDERRNDTQVLGTVGFAAPEQYGLSQSDARADIYAVGVLLNIMLTGKHPSQELAVSSMGRIVQKCTMVNPKKRYKNVLYLMEAL